MRGGAQSPSCVESWRATLHNLAVPHPSQVQRPHDSSHREIAVRNTIWPNLPRETRRAVVAIAGANVARRGHGHHREQPLAIIARLECVAPTAHRARSMVVSISAWLQKLVVVTAARKAYAAARESLACCSPWVQTAGTVGLR